MYKRLVAVMFLLFFTWLLFFLLKEEATKLKNQQKLHSKRNYVPPVLRPGGILT